MFQDDPPPDSREHFARCLQTLVEVARENGVDVEGGWTVRTETGERADWDVEIWRVRSDGRDDCGASDPGVDAG